MDDWRAATEDDRLAMDLASTDAIEDAFLAAAAAAAAFLLLAAGGVLRENWCQHRATRTRVAALTPWAWRRLTPPRAL